MTGNALSKSNVGDIAGFNDPGWYRNPEGAVARLAGDAELEADGIETPL